MEFKHEPVMLNEVIDALDIKEGGTYVDCTLGGAGHSAEIAKRLGKNGKLIGIDRDAEALIAAAERLKPYGGNVVLLKDNFYNIKSILNDLKIDRVDGILFDFGVSSYQINNPHRGFSYMQPDAPIDMRMDREEIKTAKDVVNTYSESELKRIIKDYGEERWAGRIAQRIVRERAIKEIETTFELVDIIEKAMPKGSKEKGSHPAKRTYQAIRIEVNNELGIIEKALTDGVDALKSGGRMAVITFHSLEDRIVKNTFKLLNTDCICPPEMPVCVCDHKKTVNLITKKPSVPSDKEIDNNPRAKSSKLRVIEKI